MANATDNKQEYADYIMGLARFCKPYVGGIQTYVVNMSKTFFEDDVIRPLVIEFGKRAEQSDLKYMREFAFDAERILEGGEAISETDYNNHCLEHASSYRDVLADLMNIYGFNRGTKYIREDKK